MTLRPQLRSRRLRRSEGMRNLVAQTHLVPSQLMLPVFVRPGGGEPTPISSLPGVYQHTLESLPAVILEAIDAGVSSVMIFGLAEIKDAVGSEACDPGSVLARAVTVAAQVAGGRLAVVADVCLDEFTDHGHCGVLTEDGQDVDNDLTLVSYQKMACVLAAAGADLLGLSGMMDGQVRAVRQALDDAGHSHVAILAYAAKYASAFYGPFREAVNSEFRGTRRSYQMDYRNRDEAVREVVADVSEGADIVMVKPALAYLDIVADVRAHTSVPVAAYVVSGEYAMVEFAAAQGLMDRVAAIDEALVSTSRAGADIICTYWAIEWSQRFWKKGQHG